MANQKADYDYLNWILNRNYACQGNDKLYMKEEKEAKGKKPQIVKIQRGRGVAAYELYTFGDKDNYQHLPFFNNTYDHPRFPDAPPGLIAFCDYIILAEFQQTLYVILIEMKRGSESKAKSQLEAAYTFMRYVLMSAERIKIANSMDDFDAEKVIFRRVIVMHTEKETLNSHLPKKFDKNDVMKYQTSGDFDIREVI